jgi:PIN like domain
VKIFFDEDNGTGIPRALQLIRPPNGEVHYPSNKGNQLVGKGTKDRDWIPLAGRLGMLVFSQNKRMLENAEERGLLIEHEVGAVYLSSGNERAVPVMRMLLNRWEWLTLVDATVERPFAYLVTVNGRVRKLDLRSSDPLRAKFGAGQS